MATEQVTYSTKEVSAATGVPLRTVTRWAVLGLVHGVVNEGRGRGKGIRWTPEALNEVRNLLRFRVKRLPTYDVQEMERFLVALGYNPFSKGSVEVSRDSDGRMVSAAKTTDAETLTLFPENLRGQLGLPFEEDDKA